jgi:hypothetical protein
MADETENELARLRAENQLLRTQVLTMRAVFELFEGALQERGGESVFPNSCVTPERLLLKHMAELP